MKAIPVQIFDSFEGGAPACCRRISSTLFMAAMTVLLSSPAQADELSLQSAPPVVVKTVPVAGTADVDPGLTEIRVTFSKPMADGSWSWSTWGEDTFPEKSGEPRYLDDGRTCVLPVKLQPGKFYATWLNSDQFHGFTDRTGRSAVPYLLTFDTAKAGAGVADGAAEKAFRRRYGLERPGGGAGLDTAKAGGRSADGAAAAAFRRRYGLEGGAGGAGGGENATALLNDDQRAVLVWTDRQFRSFFDARSFNGWSDAERTDLEAKSLDALKGPHNREYYHAIGTLAALRSQKAIQPLLALAADRADKDCRDRWMAIRALGMIGDKQVVPELITLVYHGNANTHWWAQISLVRLTGQNFGSDWQAWGKWWDGQGGQPPFKPEIIRWWNGQPEPDKLAESLADSDRKFLEQIAETAPTGQTPAATKAPSAEQQ
jgi:hypothetical protein